MKILEITYKQIFLEEATFDYLLREFATPCITQISSSEIYYTTCAITVLDAQETICSKNCFVGLQITLFVQNSNVHLTVA